MSRIGQKKLDIPSGVTVAISGGSVAVKGTKGELSMPIHNSVDVVIEDNSISVKKKHNAQIAQAMWGTTARLVENMITGVVQGFEKKLELNGVGYRMAVKGKNVEMALGFSHPVIVAIPDGIAVVIENALMTITGIDKHAVGQFAANIRALKPVEPYKGKGFRYFGEQVRRKEGKKASA
jgi:large subunit ribosomal protein L6